MISFKQWLVNETNYSELQQWLAQNKTDAKSLVNDITKNPPDYQGGNANFWYIPNSPFGVRLIRFSQSEDLEELQPHDNPFGDMNFGQPIANLGPKIEIVRLQKGRPAGAKRAMNRLPPDDQQKELAIYVQKLIDAANMPQEAYNKLLENIIQLNNKGYQIDPSKPGNLLIDPGEGFNLVDVNTSTNNKKDNAGFIIVMLMDNGNFTKISSPETQQAARTIIKKVEIASKLTGLPFPYSSSVEYSYKLAGLSYKSGGS